MRGAYAPPTGLSRHGVTIVGFNPDSSRQDREDREERQDFLLLQAGWTGMSPRALPFDHLPALWSNMPGPEGHPGRITQRPE
jgi:hypothetical protein